MSDYVDRDLIVNRCSRARYGQLSGQAALSDQIFLVDEDVIDATGLRITNAANPVSAQDAATKAYVDAKTGGISVPTLVSQLQNDAGYLTQHQSLSAYYTKSQCDASYQPAGSYAAAADIPTRVSQLQNDAGYALSTSLTAKADVTSLTAYQPAGNYVTAIPAHTAGDVPASRLVNGKMLTSDVVITASDIGAVPQTRTVAGKQLTADVTLAASDVGALPSTTTHTTGDVPTSRKVNNKQLTADITLSASDVGAVPTTRTINGQQLTANITLTASDVSALPSTTTHTTGDVPTSRKVNNKQLTADITLSASDVGAVPTTRTINGQQLTGDITIQTGGAYLPLSVQAGDTVVDFDGGGDAQNRRIVFKRGDKAIIFNSEHSDDDYIWLELSGSNNGIALNDGAFNEFMGGSYLQMDGGSYAEFQGGSYAKLAGARLVVDNGGQIQISSGYVVCTNSVGAGIWMQNPSRFLIEDWSQISVRNQDDDLKRRLEAFESRISALEGQVSALCAELSTKTAVTINQW